MSECHPEPLLNLPLEKGADKDRVLPILQQLQLMFMLGRRNFSFVQTIILLVLVLISSGSCLRLTEAQIAANNRLVQLLPIDVDPNHPERRNFGSLTLISAFQLESRDKRFGGLSGLSIGGDGKLYAISDRGYWLSASMLMDANGALVDLSDWRIAPILTPAQTPVQGEWRDAEALAVAHDGSFLVAFEGVHRIWRYSPPPHTFESTPIPVPIPPAMALAPSNGGLEALTVLADNRLLAITETFENPDGTLKSWVIDRDQFTELSYLPSKGFSVTDCAALDNGDIFVLERRYVPFGILSTKLKLLNASSLQASAKLVGRELLGLEQPLAVENYEGIAVQQTSKGTMIFMVSDDNYSWFQQTLLLQFLLPHNNAVSKPLP